MLSEQSTTAYARTSNTTSKSHDGGKPPRPTNSDGSGRFNPEGLTDTPGRVRTRLSPLSLTYRNPARKASDDGPEA